MTGRTRFFPKTFPILENSVDNASDEGKKQKSPEQIWNFVECIGDGRCGFRLNGNNTTTEERTMKT